MVSNRYLLFHGSVVYDFFPSLACVLEELQRALHAALDGKELKLLEDRLQHLACQADSLGLMQGTFSQN